MEDCIGMMRDLSTAKGLEDYMQKQAKYSQKCAEKAQSAAQELAQQWQKTQTPCTDLISKQLMQCMDWAINSGPAADKQ
jgi:phasin family protein